MKPSKMLSRFMHTVSEGLSKPMKGYVRDMLFGISVGRSTMLSEIGRSLGEEADLITTEMRLSRNLVNCNLDEDSMRERYLKAVSPLVQNAVVALDFSEIRKEYAEKQEWLCGIWDDTRKEKGHGYWLLNIEAIDGTGKHFPLWLEPFSQNAPGYKSQAAVVESAIQKVAAHTGKNCVWVFDRGFDGASYIEILERAGLTYCVRQTGRRKVIGEDERPALTTEVAEKIETLHIGKWRVVDKGKEFPVLFRYGSARITFPSDGKTRQLIVVRIGKHQNPLMLLTNSMAHSVTAIEKIAIAYFKRWGNRRGHATGKANLRFRKRSRYVLRGNPARCSVCLSRLRVSLPVRKTGGKNGAALGTEVLQELHAKDAAALYLLQAGPCARCNVFE